MSPSGHRISFPVFIKNVLPTLGLDGNTQEAGIDYHTGDNAVIVADREIDKLAYDGPAKIAGRALGTTLPSMPSPASACTKPMTMS